MDEYIDVDEFVESQCYADEVNGGEGGNQERDQVQGLGLEQIWEPNRMGYLERELCTSSSYPLSRFLDVN